MYKRKYIKPEIDLSEIVIKRSEGGDLTEAKEFVNDWNSKRSEQIEENVRSTSNLPFLEELYKKSLKRNVDSVKLLDNIQLTNNTLGAYYPILHRIALNTDSEDTKVHEVAHSSRPLAQEAKIKQLKSRQKYLKDGIVPNEYLDSDREIYARLMALRKSLNLDPKKKYSISEIRKLIDKHSNYTIGVPNKNGKGYYIGTMNGDGKVIKTFGPKKDLDFSNAEIDVKTEDSKSILNRYTPTFIEGLFNEVADNRKYIPRASNGMSFSGLDTSIADWYKNLVNQHATYETNESRKYLAQQGYRDIVPELDIPIHQIDDDEEESSSSSPVASEVPAERIESNTQVAKTTTPAVSTPTPTQPKTAVKAVPASPYIATTYNGWVKPQRNRTNIPYNVVQGKNIGHMIAVTNLFDKYGIKYRISSGVRNRHIGNSGGKSWHLDGRAMDIAAPNGMSNAAFLKQFVGNKALLDEMRALNYGIINEYIPENLRKTGGTGGHLHIGPDTWAWNTHAKFYNPNMPLFTLS